MIQVIMSFPVVVWFIFFQAVIHKASVEPDTTSLPSSCFALYLNIKIQRGFLAQQHKEVY